MIIIFYYIAVARMLHSPCMFQFDEPACEDAFMSIGKFASVLCQIEPEPDPLIAAVRLGDDSASLWWAITGLFMP